MSDRRVLLYFAWSRPAETGAPLAVIDDRVPAVFELRRLFYPKFESLSGRDDVDRGIAGFLDHILKPTFTAFVEHAEALACNDVIQVERVCELARLFNPFRRRTLTPLAVLDALDPAPKSGPELGSRLDAERGQNSRAETQSVQRDHKSQLRDAWHYGCRLPSTHPARFIRRANSSGREPSGRWNLRRF